MEGVVLLPSALGMTLGTLFYMIATQELVVPRSMPTIWEEVLRTEHRALSLLTSIFIIMVFILTHFIHGYSSNIPIAMSIYPQ